MRAIPHLELSARWRDHVFASVEHRAVIEQVRDESGWGGRYAFMTLMSAGIAELGLLLSSPAVVIGAMLISPLMGPIIGLGFGIATLDSREIRRAVAALLAGSLLAVLFGAAIVLASPLQNVTAEIAARTRPNLFDLMVALFSALAGAYATIHGRMGTVVGVAIATALMPPLAAIGFGLATANWSVFSGALLLYLTNFTTIALAAAAVARLYRFGPQLSPHQTLLQSLLMLGLLAALAVPLGIALKRLAWEALASHAAREVLDAEFGGAARIAQLKIDYEAVPLRVAGVVFTPEYKPDANRLAAAELQQRLGKPAQVELKQYRVALGEADAQAAAQASAAAPPDGSEQRATLAAMLGIAPDAVMVDRDAHRLAANAGPLPGATIVTYRALATRAAAALPDWTVAITPPAAPIPPVTVAADGLSPEDRAAVEAAIWGAKTLGASLRLTGSKAAIQPVTAMLDAAELPYAVARGPGATVAIAWGPPVPAPVPGPAPSPAATAATPPG